MGSRNSSRSKKSRMLVSILFLAGIISSVDFTCTEHKKEKTRTYLHAPSGIWQHDPTVPAVEIMQTLGFGVTVIAITEYGHTQNWVRTVVNPIVFTSLFCNKLCTTQDIHIQDTYMLATDCLGRTFISSYRSPLWCNYSMKEAGSFQPGKKSYFSSWSKKNIFHFRCPRRFTAVFAKAQHWSITWAS
jgi:hypothetical protein